MIENRDNNLVNTSTPISLSKHKQNFITQLHRVPTSHNNNNLKDKNHSNSGFERISTPNKYDETSLDNIKHMLPSSFKSKISDMNNTFQINHKRIHALDLSNFSSTKSKKFNSDKSNHNKSMLEAKIASNNTSPANSQNDIFNYSTSRFSPLGKTNIDNIILDNHQQKQGKSIMHANSMIETTNSPLFKGKKRKIFSRGASVNLEPVQSNHNSSSNKPHELQLLPKIASKSTLAKLTKESLLDSRIHELYEENHELKQRIKLLKEINGKLASVCHIENALPRDELHSIYQMLYVDDYKKEIEELKMKIKTLKMKNSEKSKKIMYLDKEIKSLKNIIENYRNMIYERAINNNSNIFGATNESKIVATKRIDSEASISVSNFHHHHERKTVKSAMDVSLYDRINHLIKSCGDNSTMLNIMRSIVNDTCKLFECGLARILITSPKIKRFWRESGGISNEKFMLGPIELDLITRKEIASTDDSLLNSIENMDGLRKFYNKEQAISCPVISYMKKGTMWFVLQIADPITIVGTGQNMTKRRKSFTIKEELLINLYTKIITIIIDNIVYKEKLKKFNTENDSFLNAITDFCMDNSPQDLLYNIKVKATKHLKFQNIGLLFYDVKENNLYTYDTQKQFDGNYFSVEPLKYPIKLGITGYCFMNDAKLVVVKDPRRNKYFQPEIDNTAGAPSVENIVVGLLQDIHGNKVGVIQLINREGNKEIDKNDEALLERLLRLFGALVSHITRVSGTIGLTYALKTTMEKIQHNLKMGN